MTYAVCVRCGGMKFGAYTACRECGHVPATDDELTYSLALSDHYFDKVELAEFGQAIKDGRGILFSSQDADGLKNFGDVISALKEKARSFTEGGQGAKEHKG